MKRKFRFLGVVVLALILTVSCAGEKTTGATTGEENVATSEEKTAQEGKKEPTPLPSDKELGIIHPIHLAEGMEIYDAQEELNMRTFEVPYELDETHKINMEALLARWKIFARLFEKTDGDGTPGSDYELVGVGYYDLEKQEMVPVAKLGEEPFENSNDLMSTYFYPTDDDRCIGVSKGYCFVYQFEDGSVTEIADFVGFAGNPYVTTEAIYIPERMGDDEVRVHAFDSHNYQEIATYNGAEKWLPWKEDGIAMREWRDAPLESVQELSLEGETYVWKQKERKFLGDFDITSDPDAVYVLSYAFGTNELDEDLTEHDRENPENVPYYCIQKYPEMEDLVRVRGAYINMRISGPWIGIEKPYYYPDGSTDPSYILIPGENRALRVTLPKPTKGPTLLPYDRVAGFYSVPERNGTIPDSLTIYTFEPKDKAQ